MIFDSPEYIAMRGKYLGFPNDEVPEIILLGRIDRYEGERDRIEKLVSEVNPIKQKDWIGRLVNTNHSKFYGAWFEIMLYGWLRDKYLVQVEPEINNCHPDFSIDFENNLVAIEATTKLYSRVELQTRLIESHIFSALESIKYPLAIKVDVKQFGTSINKQTVIDKVKGWLDTSKENPYYYQDEFGNVIKLSVQYQTTTSNIGVILDTAMPVVIDSEKLKLTIKGKTKQHQGIRHSDYPYVISIYLENFLYSAEEVKTAWLGNPQVIFNRNTGEIIEERLDQTGLSFTNHQKIQNTSISGLLVFKSVYDSILKSRLLDGWYIENPYARNKLNSSIFLVKGRFVVIRKEDHRYQMTWLGEKI